MGNTNEHKGRNYGKFNKIFLNSGVKSGNNFYPKIYGGIEQ